MRHSIAWPTGVRARDRIDVEPLAARDADLPVHEIEAGHHLRHRMLDLQPGVHLEEIERAVGVEQELNRAGVGVSTVLATAAAAADASAGAARDDRDRRRLLDDLLMPPLDRTLALDKRHDRPETIAKQLNLDMTRTRQPALEVDAGVAKRGAGLRSSGPNRTRADRG